MLATAAFAVLLGLFVPCTSHATEIKDTDPTTVQWDKATATNETDEFGQDIQSLHSAKHKL